MPITHEEAKRIADIILCYTPDVYDSLDLANELYTVVGQDSDNWSLRETLRMLYASTLETALTFRPAGIPLEEGLLQLNKLSPRSIDHCAAYAGVNTPELKPPEPLVVQQAVKAAWTVPGFWLCAYWFIVLGHVAVWFALAASCIMSFLYQPWYIAFPTISFAVYLLTADYQCPITRWENVVRNQLGWPTITHFTHWYLLCPFFHGRTCDRKCTAIRVGPG